MKEIYLLEVNVRGVAGEWLTGYMAPYRTQAAAIKGFKLWCLDNYIDPADATQDMTTGQYFTGCDTELFMEDDLVALSWGVNHMEVQG